MTDQAVQTLQDLRVKYRPHRFRHLAQGLSDPIIRSITLALAQGRKLQALLLRGGYGEGKTTIARLLGQRAACLRQQLHPYEPCGSCDGCRAVRKNPRSSDWEGYSEFDVQSASPRDMIDRIMNCIPYCKQGGTIMPQRVATLDEFHRLGIKDQEKFVKIIEDFGPRYDALFVICVSADASVCPAIAQRCTQRRLRPPSLQRCAEHLRLIARAEGHMLAPDDAELLAASASCVPRVYLDLLQDAIVLADNGSTLSRDSVLMACQLFEQSQGV